MLRLFIVRHGITVWNSQSRMQGHTDVPLCEEGIRQARALAQRLAGIRLDAVWSSDLQRARVTAELIAEPHGLPVRVTDRLREQMLGEWEGLTAEEIVARGDEERLLAYRRDSLANRPPGAEPLQAVWERLGAAFDAIRAETPAGHVLVVGHGGCLRAPLCRAMGAPIASMRRIWLDNASLSLIEHGPERSWVRLLNDTSHIGPLSLPAPYTA